MLHISTILYLLVWVYVRQKKNRSPRAHTCVYVMNKQGVYMKSKLQRVLS